MKSPFTKRSAIHVSRSQLAHWLLFYLACLGSLVTAAEPNPWRIAPPILRKLSADHEAARDELYTLIDKYQDQYFRERYVVDIPFRTSGIPQDYYLLIYGGYASFANEAQRIEVHVKDGRAKIELCDHEGIFRLERPADEIDRLARQLAYAFHSTQRTIKDDGHFRGRGIGSHMPHLTIEIYSNDDDAPCHLKTPAWQATSHSVESGDGLSGFMHTRLAERLHLLAWQEGTLIPADVEKRDILARLSKVPALKTDEGFIHRVDLPAIETIIYGELAISRRLSTAGADLQRLGCANLATHLEIATLDDPGPRIRQAVLEKKQDSYLAHWAIKFAQDPRRPELLQSLLDLLPLDVDHYDVKSILACAAERKLTSGQLAQIERFYRQTRDEQAKMRAAHALLQLTHDEEYFDYLETLARALPRGEQNDFDRPSRVAAAQLLEYASQSGHHRKRAYALLKFLITELEKDQKPEWSQLTGYASATGQLGSQADLPFLEKVARDESPYNAGVGIRAMAKIDPKLALTHLHRRIEQNCRAEDENYRWEVSANYDLILAERDRAAVPLLQQAWQRHLRDVPQHADSESFGPKFVIAYLQAETVDQRVVAAVEVAQKCFELSTEVRKRLADQLIAEGGDPARCREIIQSDIRLRPARGR
ncbi:hypothetical protein [Anatilimnocola floriformis]|uniref:hypothetical protein n=1 Tax=Anatilimnocola floriformis TaxID=2948575 RepID=UPI0020C3272A|nr:hypothetical protein [Anatilimnocola floriformis]